jgi:hypothetical protein
MAIACCVFSAAMLLGCEAGGPPGPETGAGQLEPGMVPAFKRIAPEVFDPEVYQEVTRALESFDNYEEVVAALKDAIGNWPELALALAKDTPPSDRLDAAWLVCSLTHLDRVEVRASTLVEHVTLAAATKSLYPGQMIPLDVYRRYVLDPRIGKYEHVGSWRKPLQKRFQCLVADDIATTARRANEWVSANFVVTASDNCYFGPLPHPAALLSVLRGSEYDACILTAGILRSIGVPARMGALGEWVEFYDGQAWKPLYPMSPQEFGVVRAASDVEKSFKPAGRIRLEMLRRGVPLKNTESFSLARWKGGCWAPLDDRGFPITEGVREDHIIISVPEGKYLATAGTRNRNGDVMIHAKEIEVKSDQETPLSFNMDIPLSELSTDERMVRKLNTLPSATFPVLQAGAGIQGETFSISATAVENNLLLVFFSLDNEPSKRMIPLIAGMSAQAKNAPTSVVFVYIGGREDAHLREFLSDDAVHASVVLDAGGAVARDLFNLPYSEAAGKFTALPSTLLIKKGGTVSYWEEGYNLNIVGAVEEALELLEK